MLNENMELEFELEKLVGMMVRIRFSHKPDQLTVIYIRQKLNSIM